MPEMPLNSRDEIAKMSRDDRTMLHLALGVAAMWIVVVAAVELCVTIAFVPQLPASVFIYFSGKATAYPLSEFVTNDLVSLSWLVIAVYAVVVAVAWLFQRRGAAWPLVAGILVCASLPFVAAMVTVSLIEQLGHGSAVDTLPSGAKSAAMLAGFLFLALGLASAFTVPRLLVALSKKRRR